MHRDITQQDTEALIFGSNIESAYPWWIRPSGPPFRPDFEPEANGTAPNGWSYLIDITEPETGKTETVRIGHREVSHAMLLITEKQNLRKRPYRHNPDPEVAASLRAYYQDRDPDHLPSEAVDQILQVAVYGGVVHR